MAATNFWRGRAVRGLSRRRVLAAGAMAGSAAWLAACGGDDDEAAAPATGGAAGAAAPTTAAGVATAAATEAAVAVQRGGVTRYDIPNVFDTVDVHRASGDPTLWLSNFIYSKLIWFTNPDTGELEGDLAESYESPDGQTYTFKLRQGVKWQEKGPAAGREFVADDVKWHIERQIAGKTLLGQDTNFQRGPFWRSVTKVETPDKATVRLTLTSPNGSFLNDLASYTQTIPQREVTEKYEPDFRTLTEEAMVGTGPFILQRWRSGEEIRWRRNPTYFRKDVPVVDGGIAPLLFADPTAFRTAFEQKQVDSFSAPDPTITQAVLNANKDRMYEVLTGVANTVFLSLNMRQQFKDVRLVRAMNLAMDRRALIQAFHQGLGQVSGPVTWLQEGYAIPPNDLIQLDGYRTDRAKEIADARALWAAGGGPALGEVDVKVPDTWLANWQDTPQIITKMFNDNLGINQIKSTKSSYNEEIIPNLVNGNFPNWFGWTSQVSTPDPRNSLRSTFLSTSTANYNKVNNPQLDALITEAATIVDRTRAVAKVREIQKILTDNASYGQIVLYNYISRSAIWNYFKTNLKAPPSAGKPGTGFNIYAGHLAPAKAWIDQRDPSYQGRPAATL